MDSFIWDRQRQKKQLLTQSTQKQTVKTIQGRVTWSREAFISLSLLHFICALLTSWSKQKWISKNSNLCENDKLTHVVIFIITGTDLWMMSKWGCVCVGRGGRGGVTGDATSTCYVCVCVCVCVCVWTLPKVKLCEDPSWLCTCVSDLPGVERTGVVVVVVCRPLTLRITGSIRQSWIHWRGRGGRGEGGREGSGA